MYTKIGIKSSFKASKTAEAAEVRGGGKELMGCYRQTNAAVAVDAQRARRENRNYTVSPDFAGLCLSKGIDLPINLPVNVYIENGARGKNIERS